MTMPRNLVIYNQNNKFDDDSDDEFGELLVLCGFIECAKLCLPKEPCRDSKLTGHEYVIELLHGHRDRCYDQFRMEKEVFINFCDVLKDKGLLKNSRCINCVGAIDGTHVDAHVPVDQQIPYRGKKIEPTQNVMCACSFDMQFTYVMVGWEGTANDSRVFLECVTKPENKFPIPPLGKYYLVDSGYTNMPGFLSPYRGQRYHLRDYRGRGRHPQGPKELFNYRHSSLRNVIERCFGVLKARFPILKQMPPYSLRKQKYIVIACCTVHNFIRKNAARDAMFDDYGTNDIDSQSDAQVATSTAENNVEINVTQAQLRYMASIRDEIARDMWAANQNGPLS